MTLRRPWLVPTGIVLVLALSSCDDDEKKPSNPAASASAAGGLTPQQASQVLAKVGNRTITLGDYAATLESMDQFERMRYQSKDRRKQLLDEMIKVELLAQEAERRGLDKKPGTRERVRLILRDELLRTLRKDLPKPSEIPEAEVRKYFAQNQDEFKDPERRRVAVLVMDDKAKAQKVLAQAKGATALSWGKLVQEHSLNKPPAPSPTAPLEMAGDLGIVSAPGATRGVNKRVPEPVRAALFKIEKQGQVHDGLVEHDGKVYIVRLVGVTAARERSYAEAERTIRVAIIQARIRAAEEALEKKLRGKFPVKVDDEALKGVKLPDGTKPAGKPDSEQPDKPDEKKPDEKKPDGKKEREKPAP